MIRRPIPVVRRLALVLCVATAPAAAAQEVVLRLNPRVGDTLHTRLEQRMEVTGAPAAGASALRGGKGMTPVTTSVILHSRSIVQQSLPTSTVVLTIVDSADIRTSDTHAASMVRAAERSMRGQRLVMRLASDGTVESARDARGGTVSGDLAQSMAGMPAVFPQQPVGVGEQWMREVPLPSGGPLGARGAGRVIAAFRLDSIGRGGTLAYVSMQGDIRPDKASRGVELTGDVQGAMQIDRARGWLTDSRFVITVHSLVTPAGGGTHAPMRFTTRVVQRLRTMDKR